MLPEKRFESNSKMVAVVQAYFKGLGKSFYKTGYEMLEKRCADTITFERDYV